MLSPTRLERVLLDATDREPDSEVIDRPDWAQVRTPSSHRPSHNQVLRARVPDDAIAKVVEEVAADHTARGATHRWVVGPSSNQTLVERLPTHGYELVGASTGMGMTAPASDRPLDVEGLTVEAVGLDMVDHFAEVTRQAWQRDAEFGEAAAYIARKIITGGDPVWFWIASLHGAPVATCNLRQIDTLGYFQGCAVEPGHRRQGVYRALIDYRLAFMRRRGIEHAVVWADATTSAHACAAAGFEPICSAVFFRRTPGGSL